MSVQTVMFWVNFFQWLRTSLRLLSDKDALEKMGDALDAAVPHNAAANILSEMSEAEEEEKEEDLA